MTFIGTTAKGFTESSVLRRLFLPWPWTYE